MAIYECKLCGSSLKPRKNEIVCKCKLCGMEQTISSSKDERVLKTIAEGNTLRMIEHFDEARSLFEQLVTDGLADAEVYWNIVLCKYRITYKDGIVNGWWGAEPVRHSDKRVSISTRHDDDYKKCLELAEEEGFGAEEEYATAALDINDNC